jgi:hydrogenase maturation protease
MINVIALGNTLRGDDAIGPVVLQELEKIPHAKDKMRLIDAGSDAFTLLEYLNGPRPNVVVDCAEMREAPGTVRTFALNEKTLRWADEAISLHGFSLAEVWAMAQAVGRVAPTLLIGVQPVRVEFNEELSEPVRKAIPKILELIIKESEKYA